MDTELNFNQSLIDLVSQQTALYNPRHPDHKNRNKIDNMWINIACQLHSTVEVCQRRWRTLRTAYGKKHKKRAMVPSGSAALPAETWPYYSQLSFLESCVSHRKSVDNLTACEGTEEAENVQPESTSSVSETSGEVTSSASASNSSSPNIEGIQRSKKRKVNKQIVQQEMVNFLRHSQKQVNELKMEVPESDRFDHFANFVAAQLRSNPPEVANHMMREITNVVVSDYSIELTTVVH